jgi:hypothetical protein
MFCKSLVTGTKWATARGETAVDPGSLRRVSSGVIIGVFTAVKKVEARLAWSQPVGEYFKLLRRRHSRF